MSKTLDCSKSLSPVHSSSLLLLHVLPTGRPTSTKAYAIMRFLIALIFGVWDCQITILQRSTFRKISKNINCFPSECAKCHRKITDKKPGDCANDELTIKGCHVHLCPHAHHTDHPCTFAICGACFSEGPRTRKRNPKFGG